ncbi:hypothetical protein C0989_012619 [Termitomyces sp. Mn162]|nr:hypothetical protein C0989_012619 [Termitomyces sp. Mn162]
MTSHIPVALNRCGSEEKQVNSLVGDCRLVACLDELCKVNVAVFECVSKRLPSQVARPRIKNVPDVFLRYQGPEKVLDANHLAERNITTDTTENRIDVLMIRVLQDSDVVGQSAEHPHNQLLSGSLVD